MAHVKGNDVDHHRNILAPGQESLGRTLRNIKERREEASGSTHPLVFAS